MPSLDSKEYWQTKTAGDQLREIIANFDKLAADDLFDLAKPEYNKVLAKKTSSTPGKATQRSEPNPPPKEWLDDKVKIAQPIQPTPPVQPTPPAQPAPVVDPALQAREIGTRVGTRIGSIGGAMGGAALGGQVLPYPIGTVGGSVGGFYGGQQLGQATEGFGIGPAAEAATRQYIAAREALREGAKRQKPKKEKIKKEGSFQSTISKLAAVNKLRTLEKWQ